MRILIPVLVAGFLIGCTTADRDPVSPEPLVSLGDFASPSELSKRMPPRLASGPLSPLVRILQSDGAEFVAAPGWSANAEVSGDAALIHGGTGSLNYVLFELGSIVDSADTLTELRIDFGWDADPVAPEGLYIGLPDHANDRWLWLDAAEAQARLLDIETHAIHGRDAPDSSYIALVNYSSSAAVIDKLTLRFRTPETVDGDEWLYFCNDFDRESIYRVRPTGGDPEVVLAYDATRRAVPEVINFAGEWKLNFARVGGGSAQEIWRSGIDGGAEELVYGTTPSNPAGHLYGADRGLFISVVDSVIELWGYSGSDIGRLSRAGDSFAGATWDLSADPGVEFAAIAALDDASGVHLVRLSGSRPFPIDAEPVELYTRLPEERAQGPEMVELATLAGEPLYYIYFSASNRDDETLNIYRLRYPGGYEPERVLVEPEIQLRRAEVSPSGRWLAYTRYAEGSTVHDAGQIWITSLLDPASPPMLLVGESIYSFSWYDPTP